MRKDNVFCMFAVLLAVVLATGACGGANKPNGEDGETDLDAVEDSFHDVDADGRPDGDTEGAPDEDTEGAPDGDVEVVPDTETDADGTSDPDGDAPADIETEDVLPDGPTECTAPLVNCSGACVDVSSDTANCGSCGHACGSGEVCGSGTCGGSVTCDPGFVDCGGDCRDVSGDPEFCGSCDPVACGDLEYCADGICVCRPGLQDCGGECVDITTDPDHCGGCGTPCGGVCVSGVCETADDCTLEVCHGACVDTETDPAYCGDCGTSCAVDQICIGGECWDYEPVIGCTTCVDCDACPHGEICCELTGYGVSCLDSENGCP